MKTLKVIPRGFPTAVCNTVDHRDVQAELINAYTDTISDELNPVPMQTGGNMHISLVDNCKPFKITTSRRVPLRFEKEANKVVDDLIAKQVIVPVKETTEWCSPAFFVPKADGIKMRGDHQISRKLTYELLRIYRYLTSPTPKSRVLN